MKWNVAPRFRTRLLLCMQTSWTTRLIVTKSIANTLQLLAYKRTVFLPAFSFFVLFCYFNGFTFSEFGYLCNYTNNPRHLNSSPLVVTFVMSIP